jgi:hypothetical protein
MPSDAGTPADDVEPAVDWQAFVPMDVADHLATMDRAARNSDCGVPWQLLAAIARVESNFGRNMATSSAGAIGYGQFLPSSWAAFGSDGNAYDYRDALPAIALYLCHAGLERDPRAALFAYNHADWYVDMVLSLAVRYDRMAPGAPTPEVLDVGPTRQQATPMRYAPGRDLRQQSRTRSLESGVSWLGVPWRGRTPGQPIAAEALDATTLAMLRAAFEVRGDLPAAVQSRGGSEDLAAFADAAWQAGLLAQPGAGPRWSADELRGRLQRGQPVAVFVGRHGLPGHPVDEPDGEQPLVLIGTTETGFIYNDPSFSSSLGYGLEMAEGDLLKYWDAAARPRQALAFVLKPRLAQAHVAQAEPPEPIERVLPSPTPTLAPTVAVAPIQPQAPAPTEAPAVIPTPTPPTPMVTATPVPRPVTRQEREEATLGWFALVGIGALGGAGVAVRVGRRRPLWWF